MLTLGASHFFTTPGIVSIARPLGLSITSTLIPSFVPADPFTPTEYHGLGRVSVGNSLGYLPHIQIVSGHQLVLDLPDELTLLSCSFKSGMHVTVDEIVRPAVLNSALMPWDRAPTLWTQNSNSQPAGGTNATLWSYTVPAGKLLWIASATMECTRSAVATSASVCVVYLNRQATTILSISSWTNVLGARDAATLGPGGMLCLPGEVISSIYQDFSSAGAHHIQTQATGFLFNL